MSAHPQNPQLYLTSLGPHLILTKNSNLCVTKTRIPFPLEVIFCKCSLILNIRSITKICKRLKIHIQQTATRVQPVAARLLRSWVRIPPGTWIFVCCECRVLSGRGLCDEPITRPEESYRLWCVVVCDLEISRICAPYIYDISSLRVNF